MLTAPASLGILIPVLNEQDNLKQLSRHLREEAAFAEIIVVDGGSTDASLAIAHQFATHVVSTVPGRAAQMNGGARVSRSDYLLFLHADTRLPGDFENKFGQWVKAKPVWGFFPLKLDGDHWLFRIIERAITIRSRLTARAGGDQGICVDRSHFMSGGGYPDIPLMEDLALCRQLSRQNRPNCFIDPVVTSSRRWEQRGIVRTILLMWQLRFLYYLGVSPRLLANWYGRESVGRNRSQG